MKREKVRREKNQVDLLELKSNNSQIKIALNELNSRLDKAEEKSLNLETGQQESLKLLKASY